MLASSVQPYLASLLVLITYWSLSPLPYHYDLGSSPMIPTNYAQLDLDHTSLHFRSPHSLLLASATPGLTLSSHSPTGHSSSHWNLWTCHPALAPMRTLFQTFGLLTFITSTSDPFSPTSHASPGVPILRSEFPETSLANARLSLTLFFTLT
ncbi:hypothetical protein B0H16DRAFT_1447161 [Mycena metata]|uniref:Uncharacterized protein n=1 Tax=Mycena metata TaxID=1033252 RepID=A0AAD7P0D6_9AGAR|nr:hypothetical protein B0H16DRAFT_1447161 [Mycena metata]